MSVVQDNAFAKKSEPQFLLKYEEVRGNLLVSMARESSECLFSSLKAILGLWDSYTCVLRTTRARTR